MNFQSDFEVRASKFLLDFQFEDWRDSGLMVGQGLCIVVFSAVRQESLLHVVSLHLNAWVN